MEPDTSEFIWTLRKQSTLRFDKVDKGGLYTLCMHRSMPLKYVLYPYSIYMILGGVFEITCLVPPNILSISGPPLVAIMLVSYITLG